MHDLTIRASGVPTWLDCRRRWAARHLPELLEVAGFKLPSLPVAIGAPIGTGAHAAAAHMLDVKRKGWSLDFGQAIDAGMAAFDHATEDAVSISYDTTAINRNGAQKQVWRLSYAFHEYLLPQLKPLAVEERLEVNFKGAVLSGQLDSLVAAGDDHALRDLKTGAVPSAVAAQVGCYALINRSHGRRVDRLLVDHIQRVPLSRPQPEPVTYELDAGEAEEIAYAGVQGITAAVERFARSGDPKVFSPNPSSKLCSARLCPAWGSGFCKAHLPTSGETA